MIDVLRQWPVIATLVGLYATIGIALAMNFTSERRLEAGDELDAGERAIFLAMLTLWPLAVVAWILCVAWIMVFG